MDSFFKTYVLTHDIQWPKFISDSSRHSKELDYELLPGSAVSIVEAPALPADLARQLQQISQRSGSGATLKQRRSDTTFEATWVIFGDVFGDLFYIVR